MPTSVVFVGVGNMGGPMAVNLSKSGCVVTAVDLNSELLKSIETEVHATSEDLLEVVAGADVLVTMLPSDQALEAALVASGALAKLKPGALVIDCSTVSLDAAKGLHECCSSLGLKCLDAPVSGGVKGAQNASLSFICGGPKEVFELAKPLLSAMGANIFHAGSAGAGQIAKIANNMLLAIHMAGTAEALSFGVDNGLDPKVLSDIMKLSSGDNWSLQKYNPWPGVMPESPASNHFAGGFMVKLMQKDLGLALAQAESSGSHTPMGLRVKELYEQLANSTDDAAEMDFSSISRLFADA